MLVHRVLQASGGHAKESKQVIRSAGSSRHAYYAYYVRNHDLTETHVFVPDSLSWVSEQVSVLLEAVLTL